MAQPDRQVCPDHPVHLPGAGGRPARRRGKIPLADSERSGVPHHRRADRRRAGDGPGGAGQGQYPRAGCAGRPYRRGGVRSGRHRPAPGPAPCGGHPLEGF